MHPKQFASARPRATFARRAALLLALLLPALGAPAQAETTLARITRTGTVVLGYRESSIPFSYVDQGWPVGYAIDLCRGVVGGLRQRLKRDLKIEFRLVTSATRIEAVRTGQIDLECGSTTNNAQRRSQVAFTVPHFVATTRIMAVEDSGIAQHGDLHRARITTTRGSTAEKLLHDLKLDGRAEIAADQAAAFALLETGKADAFLMDDILLAALRANAANPGRYRILDTSYWVEALAIMLANDDPEFKKLVDGEMSRLVLSGEMANLYHRWFEQPIPPKGINLNWPMGALLRNSLRYPSDWSPD